MISLAKNSYATAYKNEKNLIGKIENEWFFSKINNLEQNYSESLVWSTNFVKNIEKLKNKYITDTAQKRDLAKYYNLHIYNIAFKDKESSNTDFNLIKENIVKDHEYIGWGF